ncbi:MAG: type 2 isopentenyl-diphosphate Delta-isomerase [Deltaproteobacteria bacterium]|nr:type 2 isopentenyl-diphosphate Delta-isomerase [Deltaproteobacteria bacterium]
MATGIEGRKGDHLTLCATGDVGFRGQGTLLDGVRLVHDALPELSLDEIDLRARLFGKVLRAPIVIAAMTGGTDEAARVNRELASIAEERGYAFGLGSQRAMMKRPDCAPSYVVRDVAPTTVILGNIGGVQAARSSTDEIRALAAHVGADAMCVHLNPAMEIVQPEGDRDFRGVADALARLNRELDLPVVAKETGCGIGPAAARKLRAAGVRHVDVSGAGGTSWVGVETKRAEGRDERKRALGEAFWDWGVPTAVSTAACAREGFSTIIATGGVARGLDVAHAIALGATVSGVARPVLKALNEGGRAGATRLLEAMEDELRTAMLLCGARDVEALRRAPRIVVGELGVWLRELGLQTSR